MSTSPLAATTATPAVAPNPPPSAGNRPRPAAPPVSFVKRQPEHPVEPSLPLEQSGAAAQATITCLLCGSANQRGLRFCMTCGQLLANADDADQADGANEANERRVGGFDLTRTIADPTKTEPPLAPDSVSMPIAPARVIDVSPSTPRLEERVCPRCRGARDPGAAFCRFCGMALGPPAPRSSTPVAIPAPSAPPPPPVAIGPAARQPLETTTQPSAVASPARLVVITRDGSEGQSYVLGLSTDIGRSEGDIVFPDDQYASPRHARIVSRGGAFFLRDLESTNGVFVRIPFGASGQDAAGADDEATLRGQHSQTQETESKDSASEQPLADQELFLVGQQVLRFEVVKAAEEAFGAASENGTLLFGTPAAPRYARLSQRTVEGVVRDVFHVRRIETIIGRESGDIVFTDDPFLSRRHAALRMQSSGVGAGKPRRFVLADLGSSNGTFLKIRDEVCLRHGDHIRIGQQLLRFDFDAARPGV